MNLTHARHRTYPSEGAEGTQTVVSHAPNKVLSCLTSARSDDFDVFDVCTMLQIQTHCTRFIDDFTLNDLLNLLCKCAVARDAVASLRTHSCNMTLTVASVCYARSFLNICFQPRKVTPCPYSVVLDTHKPPWSGTVLQKQLCNCTRSPPILCPSLHPVEKPKSQHPRRVSISTNLLHQNEVTDGVSQTMLSPKTSREPVTAAAPQLQRGLLVPRRPLPGPYRYSVSLFLRVGLVDFGGLQMWA